MQRFSRHNLSNNSHFPVWNSREPQHARIRLSSGRHGGVVTESAIAFWYPSIVNKGLLRVRGYQGLYFFVLARERIQASIHFARRVRNFLFPNGKIFHSKNQKRHPIRHGCPRISLLQRRDVVAEFQETAKNCGRRVESVPGSWTCRLRTENIGM
ncbi:hypothetical protein RvY_07413-3 [Ramazzottius varieornatus]|uniref:Uncharacterized protein n=1 Tax=Ramazzottius varieornatus TaxID=947166 RepID=A0A1D1V218_RAMVA|nr:hypothetical protein RvY_07413-3 [Ramazzottius varieornatus]